MIRQRTPPRIVEVIQRQRLSSNLLCITFSGDGLIDFPPGFETANVKLLLPHDDQDWSAYLEALAGNGKKPLKRTYTVLEYRADRYELDVAFALHPDPGPATHWAMQAKKGDLIGIAGPGRVHRIDTAADWFLLAGDMSAQPAINANIRLLPQNAVGHIILWINDESDKRDLKAPVNMTVQWIVNSEFDSGKQLLLNAVKKVPWLSGIPSIWIAGESTCVRTIRAFLVTEKQIKPEHRYTSGYWQIGHTEDTHQLIKRNEATD